MRGTAAALWACAAAVGALELNLEEELVADGGACRSWSVAWSDDGSYIAGGHYDSPRECQGKVTLWDGATYAQRRVVAPTDAVDVTQHGSVIRVDFASGFLAAGYQYATNAYVAGEKVSANVFPDAAAAAPPADVSIVLEGSPSLKMDELALSPNGQYLAGLGTTHAYLYIMSTSDGTQLARETLTGGADLKRVVWAPNGRTLVTTASDAEVAVWEWDGATLSQQGSTPVADLLSGKFCGGVAFSSDGAQLALGCQDGRLHVYSVSADSLTEVRNVKITTFQVRAVAFSPDAAYIATGEGMVSGKLRLFDAALPDATPLVEEAREKAVRGVAFHPSDAGLLATVARNVDLWRIGGATPRPATAPDTPAPASPAPATSAPSTPSPATSAPSTPAPATPAPATTVPETSAPATPAPPTIAPETAAPATPAPATTVPETSAPATPAPQTSAPATAAPATPAPATTLPETSAPATPAPPTITPETAAPATPAPATTLPETSAPATPAPLTTVPETAAPATPAPVTFTPSLPVTRAPSTPAPPTRVPVTLIPLPSATTPVPSPAPSPPASTSPAPWQTAPPSPLPRVAVPWTATPPAPLLKGTAPTPPPASEAHAELSRQQSATAAAVAAGIAFVPVAAAGPAAGVMAVLVRTLLCPSGEADALDFTLNPLGLRLGGGIFSEYHGAVVGILGVVSVLALLCGAASVVVYRQMRGAVPEFKGDAARRYSMKRGRCGWLLMPCGFLYTGAVLSSATVLVYSDSMAYQLLACPLAAFAILLPVGCAAAARAAPTYCEYAAVRTQAGWGVWLLWGRAEWAPRGDVRGADAWHGLYRLVYDGYKSPFRYVAAAQQVLMFILGAAAAFRPRTPEECWYRALVMAVLLGAAGVFVAAARPYISPYENLLEPAVYFLETAMLVCMLCALDAGDAARDGHWGVPLAELLGTCVLWLITVKFAVDVLVFLIDEYQEWKLQRFGRGGAAAFAAYYLCGRGAPGAADAHAKLQREGGAASHDGSSASSVLLIEDPRAPGSAYLFSALVAADDDDHDAAGVVSPVPSMHPPHPAPRAGSASNGSMLHVSIPPARAPRTSGSRLSLLSDGRGTPRRGDRTPPGRRGGAGGALPGLHYV